MLKITAYPRLSGSLIITRCTPLFTVVSAGKRQGLRLVMKRLAQSFRLMVGVQDYENYCRHVRQQHPQQTPMSERDFHRRCLEARFPSEGGKMGKCPC